MADYPKVGFYFKLSFVGLYGFSETSFKEVSGISMEVDLEEIEEGGVNNYKHRLPKARKSQNLVLKRGYTSSDGLVSWCNDSIMGGLGNPIQTQVINVSLLNENGIPIKTWSFFDAWPVKWEVSSLDSMKNEIIIESLEFSYSTFKTL